MAPKTLPPAAPDAPLSRAASLAIAAAPFAILAVGLVAGLVGGGWYTWLLREDGPVENLQFLACTGAAVTAALLARRSREREQVLGALAWTGVAFVLLFAAGEEISWGQRLVGWRTPNVLTGLNRQDETNVHNIVAVEAAFRAATIGLLLCGALFSLLTRQRRPFGVPRAILAPYLVLPLLRPAVWLAFEPPPHYRIAWFESAELTELVVYLGFLVCTLLQLRACKAT